MKLSNALVSVISLSLMTAIATAADSLLTRQAFVDQQVSALKLAKKTQDELAERNIAMLKNALSKEDFEAMMAQEAAAENAENHRLAACLGISNEEFDEYREQFDTEYQIGLVQTCSASLPETINLAAGGWQSNEDLAKFYACVKDQVSQATKISESRLAACSDEPAAEEASNNNHKEQ